MTTKQVTTKKKTPTAKRNPNELVIINDKGKTKERKYAEIALFARTQNALTVKAFANSSLGEIDITDLMAVLYEKAEKINNGDLSDLESRLAAQTVTLDTMFNELARRAANNMGTHMQAAESYMRLALKAQSQCAKTAEVLATMKNPPVVFAKQANFANGNQQVNNGSAANSNPAHTEKTINQSNELLEVNHGSEKMDGRTAQTTIPKDKAMATVAI